MRDKVFYSFTHKEINKTLFKVRMQPTWAEDRAMLGSNPSADSGAKTEAGYREVPRFVFQDLGFGIGTRR